MNDKISKEEAMGGKRDELKSALKVLHNFTELNPKDKPPFSISYLTDVGNARRLVTKYGEDIHYVSAWRCWMHWNGKVWERLDEDKSGFPQLLKEWAITVAESYAQDSQILTDPTLAAEYRKHAKRCESDSKIKAMLNLITAQKGTMISYEKFDVQPHLFTCQNGTLNLETGELQESQREDYLTKVSPVAFDPEATCEVWVAFLERILLGHPELVTYLQNLAGQCMYGDTREKAFWIFWGAGGDNGKTTFIEEIQYIIGAYGQTIPIAALLRDNKGGIPVDLHTLMGSRAAFASEPDIGDELTSGMIKRITGKDTMKTRTLNEKPSQWKAQFNLILSTNNKPRITDPSIPMWVRVKCVPFSERIPLAEQDKLLWQKLEAESAGILNWMLAGCLDWLKNGMDEPEIVTSAVQEYREESDKLSDWFEYCFDLNIEGFVPFKIYYPLYKLWCANNDIRHVADTTLRIMLRDRGFQIDRGTFTNIEGEKVRERGAFGFQLKSWLTGKTEAKGKITVLGDSNGTPLIKTIIEAVDTDFDYAKRQFGQWDSKKQVDSIFSVTYDNKVKPLSLLSLQSKPQSDEQNNINTPTVLTVLTVLTKEYIKNHIISRYNKVDKSVNPEGLLTLMVEEVVNELDIGQYDDSYEVVEELVEQFLNPPEVSQREFVKCVREGIRSHQNDTENGAELSVVLSEIDEDDVRIMYVIKDLKSQGEIMEKGIDCYRLV